MSKEFYFIAGLPRSGSTLLCNILAQNPNFYATATSSLVDVLAPIKNGWDKLPGMRAMPVDQSNQHLKDTLRGVLHGYHDQFSHQVIFDKSRAWLAHIPTLEAVLGKKVKIITTVRDLRAVMASMEKLYRKTEALSVVPGKLKAPENFVSVQARVTFWAAGNNLVGSCLNLIKDAQAMGYSDRIHFVDYKMLCTAPKATLEGIYNFLEQPAFEHDFEHVEQVTQEDDRVHGWSELHTIRPKVEYPQQDYNEVLGKDVANSLKGQECW